MRFALMLKVKANKKVRNDCCHADPEKDCQYLSHLHRTGAIGSIYPGGDPTERHKRVKGVDNSKRGCSPEGIGKNLSSNPMWYSNLALLTIEPNRWAVFYRFVGVQVEY